MDFIFNCVIGRVICRGKLWAFCSSFILVFCFATAAYCVLFTPLLWLGVVQFDWMCLSAIGCGLGSAIGNAIVVTIHA